MTNGLTQILDQEVLSVTGPIERFPQKGGWFFIRVPQKITEITRDVSVRGLVAISASLGTTTWNTSLLPMGDGTHFIALSAHVRVQEQLSLHDTITIQFKLRNR